MTDLYRSGLRGFDPPLAMGGHGFAYVALSVPHPTRLDDAPDRPGWWRCDRCGWQGPTFALTERRYPMPCTGGLRALPTGPA